MIQEDNEAKPLEHQSQDQYLTYRFLRNLTQQLINNRNAAMKTILLVFFISFQCLASTALEECESKIDYSFITSPEGTNGSLMEGVYCTNLCTKLQADEGLCKFCPQPQQIQSATQGYFIVSKIKYLAPGESVFYKNTTYECTGH